MLVKKNSFKRIYFIIIVTVALSLTLFLNTSFQTNEYDFQIKTDKQNYQITDRVFVSIPESNRDDSGTLIVTDPNNQIYSKMFFSGRTGVIEPYIDLPRYAEECMCDVTGLWKIQYDVIEGDYYQSTLFQVD